jgi:hypothetical protein
MQKTSNVLERVLGTIAVASYSILYDREIEAQNAVRKIEPFRGFRELYIFTPCDFHNLETKMRTVLTLRSHL